MNVGILGAGNIGGTLGKKLAARGHQVILGVRDPGNAKAQAAQGPGIRVGSMQEAVTFGDVVVVALPLDAARDLLPSLEGLSDKIVVDTTNAFAGLPAGYPSAAAAIVDWSGSRRVVKAFNATPWEALADPVYAGQAVETFVCGDDVEARGLIAGLARETGFEVIELGGLANAALTENFARLWGTLASGAGLGRGFAFKIVRR